MAAYRVTYIIMIPEAGLSLVKPGSDSPVQQTRLIELENFDIVQGKFPMIPREGEAVRYASKWCKLTEWSVFAVKHDVQGLCTFVLLVPPSPNIDPELTMDGKVRIVEMKKKARMPEPEEEEPQKA